MSNNIDERVVSMKFDNATFEQRVSNTMSTLEKLKAKLNFGGQAKGFEDINAAANSVNMSGMAAALDNISNKFSVMGAVAFSVINNVVSMAMSAGASIVKSLAITPVLDGFREYETNMNSIQTILANTKSDGSTLSDVNAALDQLNEYSDKTIYNFSEMARNIGTFTAAGVNLEDSVNAIKGIANLAAISGSNSQQASTAMYQLSQALAAGKVNLMDWNSVVNAGMGGEVFKKALFETGKALGTIKDVPLGATFEEWEKKGGTFREQMEKGWLTADVLKTTLGAFSGELDAATLMAQGFSATAAREMVELGKLGVESATQVKTATQLMGTIKESIASGWSASFKIIVGNFEEAKELWTGVNNAVGGFVNKMADARNDLLQGWKNLGGRTTLIQGLGNAFSIVGNILQSVGKAFRDVFPAKTAQDLAYMTLRFREFFDKLKPSLGTLQQLRIIFRGFFSGIAIGIEIVKNVAGVFKELFSSFQSANGGQIFDFLSGFAIKVTQLKETLVDGGGISKFFETYIYPIARFLGSLNIAGLISNVIGLFGDLASAIKDFFGSDEISGGADNITSAVDRVGERFGWLQKVGEKLGELGEWLRGKLDKVVDVFRDMLGKIAEVFSGADTDAVFDALNAGLLAGIVALLAKFMKDGFKIDFGGGFMENLSGSLEQLTGTLDAMQKNLKAEALMKIAIAIGIITASVLVLSMIDSAALTKAMIGLTVGFGILIGAMAMLGKVTDEYGALGAVKMIAIGAALILLAGAVLVLSLAVKMLSTMDVGELAKGLIAVGLMLAMLTLAINNMPDEGRMIASGIGILAMAAGLVVMSLAVKILGSMDTGQLIQGLIGVGVALGMMVLAVNNMPNEGKVLSAAVAMIAMGIALNIIAAAVAVFGTMELSTLVQGLIAVAVAIGILVAAVNLFPDEGRLLATAAAMVAMGIALNIIAGAIAILGNMGLGDLIQGLIGLAAALLIITVAMAAMSGVVAGAVGMVIAAGAIAILAAALKVLGGMEISQIIIALVAVAAALAVITIAALLIQPALPALLGLGVALALIGLGGALFGVAAVLIATAIGMIVAAIRDLVEIGVEGVKVFAETLPIVAVAIADAMIQIGQRLAEALPALITSLGAALTALLQVLIDNVPKFGELMTTLVQTMLQVLRDNVPDIIATGLMLLMSLLQGISDNIEQITNTVIDIITKFLNTLAERAEEIVTAGLNLLTSFLLGIANNIENVAIAAGSIIVKFIEGLDKSIQDIVNAGGNLIVNLITGFSNKTQEIIDAGGDAIIDFIEGLGSKAAEIAESAGDTIVDFLEAIADTIYEKNDEIREQGGRIAGAILDGITGGLSGKAGEVKDKIGEVLGGAVDFGKSLLGINSPSKVFIGIAENMAEGLVVGLNNDTTVMRSMGSYTKNMIKVANSAAEEISSIMGNMEEFNPTITPVLDLSYVRKDANSINSLISSGKVNASVSLNSASDILASNAQREATSSDTVTPQSIEVKLEQNNYSPEALNAKEIYRQTRSLVTMVEQALDSPERLASSGRSS